MSEGISKGCHPRLHADRGECSGCPRVICDLSGVRAVPCEGDENPGLVFAQAFVVCLLYRMREDKDVEQALWKIGLPVSSATRVVKAGNPSVYCLQVGLGMCG